MTKELQNHAWSLLPKEFKEEVKKEYEHQLSIDNEQAYWMLERIFSKHNLTSDAEEEEMLTCVKDQAVKLYNIANKAYAINRDKYYQGYMNAMIDLFGSKCLPDKEEKMTEERYQYLNSLSLEDYDNETSADEQRQFCEYQHKHHPDEVTYFQTHSDEKPKTAEPKFKVGDTASYVCSPTLKHKCTVTKVMQNEHSGKWEYNVMFEWGKPGMWTPESDLEPYIEPTDLDKESSTCTNDCPSQCPSQNFDNIVNRGFRDHNRLHIAAQIVAALYANYQAAKGFKSIEELVREALDITDTLIKESEKGGSK